MYAKSSKAFDATLRVADRVLRAVGMELGLRKCAVAHVKQGKYVSEETTFCRRRGRLNEYPREVPTSTWALSNCSLLTIRTSG